MGGWQVLQVRCRACGHEFVSVCPVETPRDRLECGRCHAQDSRALPLWHQHPAETRRIRAVVA